MATHDEKGIFKTEPTRTIVTAETNDNKVITANLFCSPLAFCQQLLDARRAAKEARTQQKVEMEIQECLPVARDTAYHAAATCGGLLKLLEAKCTEIATRADYTLYAIETFLPLASDDLLTSSYQDFKAASLRSMTQLMQIAVQAAQTATQFARNNVDGSRALLDEACEAELYGPFYGHGRSSLLDKVAKTRPTRKRPTMELLDTTMAALNAAVEATASPNDDWHIPDSQYEEFNHLHMHLKRMRDTYLAHYRLRTAHPGFSAPNGWWYQGEKRTTSSALEVSDVANRIRRAHECVQVARDAMLCANEVRQRTADQVAKELRALGPSCTVIPKQLEQVDVTFGVYRYNWVSAEKKRRIMDDQATHIMKTAYFGIIRPRPDIYY